MEETRTRWQTGARPVVQTKLGGAKCFTRDKRRTVARLRVRRLLFNRRADRVARCYHPAGLGCHKRHGFTLAASAADTVGCLLQSNSTAPA